MDPVTSSKTERSRKSRASCLPSRFRCASRLPEKVMEWVLDSLEAAPPRYQHPVRGAGRPWRTAGDLLSNAILADAHRAGVTVRSGSCNATMANCSISADSDYPLSSRNRRAVTQKIGRPVGLPSFVDARRQ